MPARLVRVMVRIATRDRCVALCLHRVGGRYAHDQLFPELTQPASDVDELLSYFSDCPWRLTVTFDDAYADAVDYVASRAPRHPDIAWLINICAKKTLDRDAHTWDIWAQTRTSRESKEFLAHWRETIDRGRLTLDGDDRLADDDRFLLATSDRCREVGHLRNVELGNHTDHHLPMAWLDDATLRAEIETSERRFDDEFGRTRHLVLPFGCEPYVGRDDIARVAAASNSELIWTVDSRPYRPGHDRVNGVDVRARFGWGVNDLRPRAKALYIAAKCVADRLGRDRSQPAEVISLAEVGEPAADRDRALA